MGNERTAAGICRGLPSGILDSKSAPRSLEIFRVLKIWNDLYSPVRVDTLCELWTHQQRLMVLSLKVYG